MEVLVWKLGQKWTEEFSWRVEVGVGLELGVVTPRFIRRLGNMQAVMRVGGVEGNLQMRDTHR